MNQADKKAIKQRLIYAASEGVRTGGMSDLSKVIYSQGENFFIVKVPDESGTTTFFQVSIKEMR